MVLVVERLGNRVLLFARHARNVANFSVSNGFSYPGARSLEQIVKLDLLENEHAPKIRSIWEEFHADKDDAVAMTLDAIEFQALVTRATAAPYFVLPVYRQEGYFNMLCQFQQSCFLVTYLEAFKENPAAAPPCIAVSLYIDLLETKKLVLLRADVINMLDKNESQQLLMQLLTSYQNDKLYEHVDKFNNKPDQFDFEAYRLMMKKIVI
ncbi:protein mitochondrial precursor [Plasmopara halstedii]|uniref:Protein mitochondrial n=1 Tax=Plasmopara halstedii TaxID=4781 RepID=A0A0P1A4H6_PLAHL|nr:protein mitochondrial precursor [Plasmopara halstedii]CEG35372.1 protein mitochondrial precursor [Plasmopara halstedii]|eukprot:XP_024571741.1 protein mitochondrial precursor [Plasmopara halstedii]